MKILFCIKALNNPGGGAERVLVELANELVAKGHQVAILSYDKRGGESFYRISEAVDRLCLGVGSTNKKAKFIETITRMVMLRRVIKEHAPMIVIGFMHSMYIPLSIAMYRIGIPLIASEHIVPKHFENRLFERTLLRASPYLCTCITVVSEQVKKLYMPYLKDSMVVIPNPVFTRNEKVNMSPVIKKRNVILSVGRLEQQKDFITLIKAFSLIYRACKSWKLRIVGDGSEKDKLLQCIKEHKLEKYVELPGFVQNISDEYQKASFYVCSSSYESYGLTVAEAISHKLPAIGFDNCPGVNTLIRNCENGLLVQGIGNRCFHLSQTIKRLALNPELLSNLSNQKKVPDMSCITKIADSWESLIKKTLVGFEH